MTPVRGQYGFTLIELSIVFVIIGLLAGGIWAGKELVRNAGLVQQIKQMQQYQNAFYTFIDKYDCTPGDCSNATVFFGATDGFGNAVNNGNGNGLIDTGDGQCYDSDAACGSDTWKTSPEMWGALQQLSLAHLIGFTPSEHNDGILGNAIPSVSLNSSAGFFFGASYNFGTGGRNPVITSYQVGTNALWMIACGSPGADHIGSWDNNCGIFTASDLEMMDRKIDDDMPLKGKLFGFGGYGSNNNCLNINGSASTYKTSVTTQQCQAAYLVN